MRNSFAIAVRNEPTVHSGEGRTAGALSRVLKSRSQRCWKRAHAFPEDCMSMSIKPWDDSEKAAFCGCLGIHCVANRNSVEVRAHLFPGGGKSNERRVFFYSFVSGFFSWSSRAVEVENIKSLCHTESFESQILLFCFMWIFYFMLMYHYRRLCCNE